MKRIESFFYRMRSLPEGVRRFLAVACLGVAAVVLFGFWGRVTTSELANLSEGNMSRETPPLAIADNPLSAQPSENLNDIKVPEEKKEISPLGSLGESFGAVFEKVVSFKDETPGIWDRIGTGITSLPAAIAEGAAKIRYSVYNILDRLTSLVIYK